MELMEPVYVEGRDTSITCEYRQNEESFDIIAGGSGFHQTLTLLAFLFGYHPTTILLDEPDAHMYGSLQREVLEYFKQKCRERRIQFLVATHAEEFIRGVDHSQVVSLLRGKPERLPSSQPVIAAMSSLTNLEVTKLRVFPVVVYVEGEDDERILRAWAPALSAQPWIQKLVFHYMHGGSKKKMKDDAEAHFSALQAVIPGVKKIMIFDYDSSEVAFHPSPDNPVCFEWNRRNIENYLLVEEAWARAVSSVLADNLFVVPCINAIHEKFVSENLTLPIGTSWRTQSANIFKVVDGKRILFSDKDSLFSRLLQISEDAAISRETIAGAMQIDELHEDVIALFGKLKGLVADAEQALSQ
jgi:hypothetical protein